ncbi:hypothetical protein ACFQH5_14705 [Halomonas salifodinae]|uniref:Uncharacterized protein n=1 Tax=Halomonas salifodinae TaxID=438745 RepID=A0ABW2EXS3_9GAMM
MSKYRSNRAIVVLEAPWELDTDDANRTSVLPFIEGIAKLTGDTEVHYANFYDERSFQMALDCLCKGTFDSRTVYIAAHGYKRTIGGMDIVTLLTKIALKSKKYHITGVMLGSCFVGEHATSMEVCLQESRLRWCAGYASESKWLEGTLIDCSILAHMSALKDEVFDHRERIASELAGAIEPFRADYPIGDDYQRNPVRLGDSLRFVAQPRGRGNRARDVTALVWG